MTIPDLSQERRLWSSGITVVAGVDEVGRGAWAGPVVAAAAILSPSTLLYNEITSSQTQTLVIPQLLRDSKKLSAAQRQQVAIQLKNLGIMSAVGVVEVDEINSLGLSQANYLAMQRAINALSSTPEFVLIDGFCNPLIKSVEQQAIIKGDAAVASIAAASVLAKIYRDNLMEQLDSLYPQYGFAKHKGYGTKLHQQAILQHGLSVIHRSGYKLKFYQNTE